MHQHVVGVHGLALPPRPPRRRGDAAPRRRRRDRARLHRRRRLHPTLAARPSRSTVATASSGRKAVRQPVAGRHGDVDDVRRTTTPSRAAGCSTWPCRSPPRASASSTTGTPSACAAPASNDVVLDDVFVPDERVLANRPYGVARPAAPGDRQHRLPDRLRRLPRRGRGGLRGTLSTPRAARADDPDGAAPGRPDAAPAAGRGVGPRRRARRGRRRPARRRRRRWPR